MSSSAGPADGRERAPASRCAGWRTTICRPTGPSVATVQAMEAILRRHSDGRPGCVAIVNGPLGGLVLQTPGEATPIVLYEAAGMRFLE